MQQGIGEGKPAPGPTPPNPPPAQGPRHPTDDTAGEDPFDPPEGADGTGMGGGEDRTTLDIVKDILSLEGIPTKKLPSLGRLVKKASKIGGKLRKRHGLKASDDERVTELIRALSPLFDEVGNVAP